MHSLGANDINVSLKPSILLAFQIVTRTNHDNFLADKNNALRLHVRLSRALLSCSQMNQLEISTELLLLELWNC